MRHQWDSSRTRPGHFRNTLYVPVRFYLNIYLNLLWHAAVQNRLETKCRSSVLSSDCLSLNDMLLFVKLLDLGSPSARFWQVAVLPFRFIFKFGRFLSDLGLCARGRNGWGFIKVRKRKSQKSVGLDSPHSRSQRWQFCLSSESQDDLTFPEVPYAAFLDRQAFKLTFFVQLLTFYRHLIRGTMRTDS